jgi:succinylglutamic semialdehyde dehydrogenase
VSEALLRSFDPATGEEIWAGAQADTAAIRAALARAHAAFPGWAATPLDTRIAHARSFKAALEARAAPLAELIARETGKVLWDAQGEVAAMIGKVELSIRAQAERAGTRETPMPFGAAVLRHRPHGVMAVLGPYNFPGHLPNGHIVPALLAGDVVVFKPSELTPAVGAAMAECWAQAGLPMGVFQVVQGGRDTGAALVEGEIDGLLFTGSVAAGAVFRRAFVDRPHVVLALELGGNNPLVAWDGDIAEAAATVVQSACISSGQRCSCARRLIVPDSAFGRDLVEAVADMAQRLRVGAWNDVPEPYMGPLIGASAAAQAHAAVAGLEGAGARTIVAFGGIDGRPDSFVTPALLDVTGCVVPDAEIFAPVLQVIRVPDFDAALAAANQTRYGLSAGLISADDALWQRFGLTVRAGVINRNRPTTGAAGSMPFGGLGASGNHRPSAFYAADYCAYPVASFEAADAQGNLAALAGMLA